jgi:NADH-quinone oxidoreductase subunit M
VLVGSFQASTVFTALAATGLILGAAYGLWLYRRVVFGELLQQALKDKMPDLNCIEWLMFVPLVILVLWLGIYPSSVLDALHPATQHLLEQVTPSTLP